MVYISEDFENILSHSTPLLLVIGYFLLKAISEFTESKGSKDH